MKKVCFLICCVLIMQLFCACADSNEDIKSPVNFYYLNKEISYNSPSGVIQAEVREGAGFHGNPVAFLRSYLLGPTSAELQSPIPADVYLVSCEVNGDVVNIVLSSQFSKLSGVKLSTACSAILLTLHDYIGTQTIEISAKNSQLDDKNTFVITMDDIVLIDSVNTEE